MSCYHLNDAENEATPEIRASCASKGVQACLCAGMLPDCYDNTAREWYAPSLKRYEDRFPFEPILQAG